MSLEDYLLPGENVRFQSNRTLVYSGKPYQVIITDRRLILYARRGLIFKGDDLVTESLTDVRGVKYREKGMIAKKGLIEVLGKTKLILEGRPSEVKPLY